MISVLGIKILKVHNKRKNISRKMHKLLEYIPYQEMCTDAKIM